MDQQVPCKRTPHIGIVLALLVAGACRAVTPIGALAAGGQAPDSAVDSARAPDGDTGSGGIDTRPVPEPDAAVDLPPPATDGPRALGPCEGGRLQWARGTRSSGPVISRVNFLSTALSPDGTAWVTGDFVGTVTFWAGQPGEITRSTSTPDFAGRELFLLKISPDGALLKFITVTHGCGGNNQPGGTEGRGVAALADGSVLLMGNFTREVTIGTNTLNARGSQAMFLARYRADGSPLWVAGAVGPDGPGPWGPGCSPAQAMKCDGGCGTSGSGVRLVALPDGRSRVLGSAGNGTTFLGTTGTTTVFRGIGGAYAAAYAADGAHEWARLVGGTQPGEATVIADGSTFHTNAALLTRISSDGTFLWTKGPGATGNPVTLGSVVAFSDGSTITSGGLNGTIVFGAGEPRETALTVPHYLGYLASYQADGSLAWVRLLSADFDRGNGSWAGGHLAAFPTGGFALAGAGSGAFRVDLSGWGACGGVVTGRVGESSLLLARFDSSRSIMWSKIEGTDGGNLATAADGSTLITSHNWTNTVTLGRGEPNETTLPAAEQFHNNAFVAKFGP
jgi:hypothetical protein